MSTPAGPRQDTGYEESFRDHLGNVTRDGKRLKIYPKRPSGRYHSARRVVSWFLLAFLFVGPFLRINGQPLLLLNIVDRKFVILGIPFWPQDLYLFLLALLSLVVFIVLFTAVFGRLWCGWACPQTIYLEYVFRPLERLFEGTKGRGGKANHEVAAWRVGLKYLTFLVVSLYLAHTFLAWFVGVASLRQWITGSPFQHPAAFLVMAATTGLMMFNFCFFREQLCIIACPYGRFQSVLLDRLSLIVSYDSQRGEPRGKLQKGPLAPGTEKHGDCINCGLCVAVCPTGIDIRQGLQMECVNCTQCIDACDSIMAKVDKAPGLIRYGSQAGMAGEALSKIRPRVILYPLVLVLVLSLLTVMLFRKQNTDVTLLRHFGLPFTQVAEGQIANPLRLKITNRLPDEKAYEVTLEGVVGQVLLPENPLRVAGDAVRTEALTVVAPWSAFHDGQLKVTLVVSDGVDFRREVPVTLLGPQGAPPAAHDDDHHESKRPAAEHQD